MVAADKRIKDLVKLTKARSKTDRTLLYRHIAHLIIHRQQSLKASNSKSLEDTAILFDLFDALSTQVDVESRRELAQDLSRMEDPPEELIMRLAIDNIAVAEALLKSAKFSEKNLLEVINKTEKPHHLVITERSDLNQKLWQAIVNNRDSGDIPPPVEITKPKDKTKKEERLLSFPSKSRTKTTGSEDKKYRAIDLFVPGNDQKPAIDTIINKDNADDLPNYYLGKPPQKTKPESKATLNDESPIYWAVGRSGEIIKIDDFAENLFNTPHDQLLGSNLWQQLNIIENSPLHTAIIKHHPIRNLVTEIHGTDNKIHIIAHALFDRISGRFEGFEGTFKPVEDELNTNHTRSQKTKIQKQQALTNELEDPATGHVLAAHLSADASTPIQDMLEGIQRIARAARRNNDQTMLTDIRSIMSDCFKLRDMVEDTERIARMFGGSETYGGESFDVFKVLNSCLDDDTTRHGNISKFQLLPQTTNPMVNFSRTILRQAFARMLEIARETNANLDQPIPIYVHPVEDGRLEVIIPLGALTGDKSIDARDLNTDDRLKLGVVRRKRSGDAVMTASLGLSALGGSIKRLGGKLDIVQSHSIASEHGADNNSGSVSIRLPTL